VNDSYKSLHPAFITGHHPVNNGAAPAFNDPESGLKSGQRAEWRDQWACSQFARRYSD
jgi:hypothetical protein